MICIHGHDPREMALALLSVSRRCEVRGTRFSFVGSEPTFERARVAARDLQLSGFGHLRFLPLSCAGQAIPATSWDEAVAEVTRALCDESAAGSGVAWVESPVPADGDSAGLFTLGVALREAAIPSTALLAFERSAQDGGTRASLLDAFGAWIDARTLLPECPRWFLDVRGDGQPGFLSGAESDKRTTVGQLGAVIAHEVGNPLSIISSSLQYLHERLVLSKDDASEFTSAALANVDRIQILLRRMLEAGAAPRATFQLSSLNQVIPDLLSLTATEFERHGVSVGATLDGRIPASWIDLQGLKQVVLNLLKNGLDALAGKGGTLIVRTRLLDGGDRMTLEIENDGSHLDPDVVPNLFRPFHSTKVGGTGLGLYLSRQIARDHGGDLVAEDLPKSGVRFTLLLPIDQRKRGERGEDPDRR